MGKRAVEVFAKLQSGCVLALGFFFFFFLFSLPYASLCRAEGVALGGITKASRKMSRCFDVLFFSESVVDLPWASLPDSSWLGEAVAPGSLSPRELSPGSHVGSEASVFLTKIHKGWGVV